MGKTLRILAVVGVIGLVFAAIITSVSVKPSNGDKVWHTEMTLGSLEAKNYFVVYSDLMCPYCVAFENAIIENEDKFLEYLTKNDVLFEVRISDFLYEYGETRPIHSQYAAEVIFCAKNAGRFWDYYKAAIKTVWQEYFKPLGKGAFSAFNQLGKDYWVKIGEKLALGEDFKTCVENGTALSEVKSETAKTAKIVNGMPYFKFNDKVASGFDLTWGWDRVLQYFDAGLKK